MSGLVNQEIVITEKLDGSNLALTRNDIFARSHNGPPCHPSFHWAKAFHAQRRGAISEGLTLFGEYCYAVHSIAYNRLPGYFFLFGVREDAADLWWNWELVEEQARALGIPTVPVLFRGVAESEGQLRSATERLAREPSCYGPDREGVVVRVRRTFKIDEFGQVVAKFVRAGHVTTTEHWMFQQIRVQSLAEVS